MNTASGVYSLTANTSGGVVSNTTGILNTAVGSNALRSNTTGDTNTALGFNALQFNTTGGGNVAVDAALNSTPRAAPMWPLVEMRSSVIQSAPTTSR